MQSIDGRVSKFLYNSMGFLSGFVLGRGPEIRFWRSQANVGAVTETVTIGSRVEVQDDLRTDDAGQEYLHAALIMNLDSRRNASLPALVCPGKPGMLSDGAHNTPASPVDEGSLVGKHPVETVSQPDRAGDAIALNLRRLGSHLKSPCSSDENTPGSNALQPRATATDAGTAIERAYDGLHRIQAILAYLHIVKRYVPGISQFLDEAKHTYEQALARYAAQYFEGENLRGLHSVFRTSSKLLCPELFAQTRAIRPWFHRLPNIRPIAVNRATCKAVLTKSNPFSLGFIGSWTTGHCR